jgi:hypothetical protein
MLEKISEGFLHDIKFNSNHVNEALLHFEVVQMHPTVLMDSEEEYVYQKSRLALTTLVRPMKQFCRESSSFSIYWCAH